MILTTCAACAAPLAHDAPRCVRCSTRYCNHTCLHDHWRRGHKFFCKTIQSGGGAEQFHADGNYEEAVAVAVEACADDTAGQTCYICYCEGDEEGLVRGCACRGESGIAHVSCLMEQARRFVEQAERRNLRGSEFNRTWTRWYKCGLCEQKYHGVVACALGWACWKTYLGGPETDQLRSNAMNVLGSGLYGVKHHEEALSVKEAELATMRRVGDSESNILTAQGNLAGSYARLGRREEANRLLRDVYSGHLRLYGEEHEVPLRSACNYANGLRGLKRFEEVKSLMRRTMPVARRVLGEGNEHTLKARWIYAVALYDDPAATLDDLREAVTTLEDTERVARRVLGGAHPVTVDIENNLRCARAALGAREALPSPSPPASLLYDADELD